MFLLDNDDVDSVCVISNINKLTGSQVRTHNTRSRSNVTKLREVMTVNLLCPRRLASTLSYYHLEKCSDFLLDLNVSPLGKTSLDYLALLQKIQYNIGANEDYKLCLSPMEKLIPTLIFLVIDSQMLSIWHPQI